MSFLEFDYVQISEYFHPRVSFSKVNLTTDEFKMKNGESYTPYETFDGIFHFDPTLFSSAESRPEELKESIEKLISIIQSRKTIELESVVNTEKEVLINIAKKVLVPLFGNVAFEKSYRASLWGTQIPAEPIGFGSQKTWYGTPDLRIHGCVCVSTSGVDKDEGESDSDESDGDELDDSSDASLSSISIEGKVKSQLVATAVTYSFTMASIQPTLNTLVPTILLNRVSFQICLYDCETDLLLISGPKCLVTTRGCLSESGVLLLWLCVNHRFFVNKLKGRKHLSSTLIPKLQVTNSLDDFKQLSQLGISWGGKKNSKAKKRVLSSEFCGENVPKKQKK